MVIRGSSLLRDARIVDAGSAADGIEHAAQLPAEIQGQEMAFGLLPAQAFHDVGCFQVVAFSLMLEVERLGRLAVAQQAQRGSAVPGAMDVQGYGGPVDQGLGAGLFAEARDVSERRNRP